MAKFTSLISLNEPWDALTSWWVIVILALLLLIETTVDKIPAVDHINDIIQAVIRPLAGAILFAASSGVVGHIHPVLALVAGLLLAGSVHAVKATARPMVTASTGGAGNWLVSILEDIWSFFTSVFAIVIPILSVIFIIGLVVLVTIVWRHKHRPRQYVN
jgi:hypothetical protein